MSHDSLGINKASAIAATNAVVAKLKLGNFMSQIDFIDNGWTSRYYFVSMCHLRGKTNTGVRLEIANAVVLSTDGGDCTHGHVIVSVTVVNNGERSKPKHYEFDPQCQGEEVRELGTHPYA